MAKKAATPAPAAPAATAKPKPAPKGATKPKPAPKGATKPKPAPKGGAKPKPAPKGGAKPKTNLLDKLPKGLVPTLLVLLAIVACIAAASFAANNVQSVTQALGLGGQQQAAPPAQGGQQQQAAATAIVPPAQATVAPPVNGQNMTVAGGDFFARGAETLPNGFIRIREAGNRDLCAWSNTFKMEISNGVSAQVPHCWEMRLTGTGTARFTFVPDATGYKTSDTLGTGLAFWPSGTNGEYRVTRNGVSTAWIPLTTGPEGVNFQPNGGEVTIEVKLANGFMAMPLGEIRNKVMPLN